MSEHGQPTEVHTEPAEAAPTSATHERADGAEESVLDALEADLAAVEHAIERLDRVTEQGIGGDDAAKEIAVAVPLDRFDLPADGSGPQI